GRLQAGLPADAATRDRNETRALPCPVLIANDDDALAVLDADDKAALDEPRHNGDALSVFEQRGRDALEGNRHDFLQDSRSALNCVLLGGLAKDRARTGSEQKDQRKQPCPRYAHRNHLLWRHVSNAPWTLPSRLAV